MKLLFPAWFACRTHVPAERNETSPELMEQTADEDPATVIVAVKPDVAAAMGIYLAPWAVAMVGAVVGAADVKLTV